MQSITYGIVESNNLGDKENATTLEIWPHKNGGYYVSASPTRHNSQTGSSAWAPNGEAIFPTIEMAQRALEEAWKQEIIWSRKEIV